MPMRCAGYSRRVRAQHSREIRSVRVGADAIREDHLLSRMIDGDFAGMGVMQGRVEAIVDNVEHGGVRIPKAALPVAEQPPPVDRVL